MRLAIYEINTAVWLGGHSLANVPARRWDAIAALGVDAVWGVWRRSPAGLAIAAADEARSAAFGQARAAAVVMSTLPGARLYHDGQLSGKRTHVPVFLGRGPDEPPDADLRAFYAWLLPLAARMHGTWTLLDLPEPLVGWTWDDHEVVVNLSDAPARDLGPWGYRVTARPA